MNASSVHAELHYLRHRAQRAVSVGLGVDEAPRVGCVILTVALEQAEGDDTDEGSTELRAVRVRGNGVYLEIAVI